ncbi:MAG: hypothetical protein LBJ00_08300 [Planctomycetaceae bacterium]|jgi:hypothetical protein|nr:hypothetical protein [Planctomycetaceae bacterium]
MCSKNSENLNVPNDAWVTVLSPTSKTVAGKWTGFVCRVSFTTNEANVVVRLRGECVVLKKPDIYQTSGLLIANPDTNAITVQGGNIVFGDGNFVGRGDPNLNINVTIQTTGSHFVDFLFFDADQNAAPFPEGPLTQVWGKDRV